MGGMWTKGQRARQVAFERRRYPTDLSDSEWEQTDAGLGIPDEGAEGPRLDTARQTAEPVYGFKVLVNEGTDRVLGARLAGPHADEVINLFALAIRYGLTATAVKERMFSYPTGASNIGYML